MPSTGSVILDGPVRETAAATSRLLSDQRAAQHAHAARELVAARRDHQFDRGSRVCRERPANAEIRDHNLFGAGVVFLPVEGHADGRSRGHFDGVGRVAAFDANGDVKRPARSGRHGERVAALAEKEPVEQRDQRQRPDRDPELCWRHRHASETTAKPARATASLTISGVARSSSRSWILPTSIVTGSMPGTALRTRVRLLTQPPHDMPAMMKVLSVWLMMDTLRPYNIPPSPISQHG